MSNNLRIYTSGSIKNNICLSCTSVILIDTEPETCPNCNKDWYGVTQQQLDDIDNAHMNNIINMSNENLSRTERKFYKNYNKKNKP